MNNIVLKRVIAYLVDFMIVASIASIFSYIPFLNPNRLLYEEKYNEILSLYEQLESGDLSRDDYQKAYYPLYYDLNHLNLNYAIINMIVLIGYFGFFQWQFGGQTIGKKLLKIKVVTLDENRPSIVSHLIRTVILNNIVITILQIIVLFSFSVDNFYPIYTNINLVGYILLYILVFLVFVRQDHRGLHDMIASTKVIMVENAKEEVIEEAKYKEVKKPKKSTKSKK